MSDHRKKKAESNSELAGRQQGIAGNEAMDAAQLRESEKLLRTIAENYPNSYLSVIEKDLAVGFSSGQEFKKQNLDPEQFIGMTLEEIFGDKADTVREYYKRTFEGEECSFELYTNEQYQYYRTVPLFEEDGSIPRILAVVENITGRIKKEGIERLHLMLWEYSSEHNMDELMQKALDEIGKVTESPIGFYHFVDEDQVTLTLQAWSTRTLAEFCQTEGKGMHYPIDEAGVWVDCVRERKPVIHNDYASLPHRRGLPDGHAEVIRELVVPTIYNGKIVAILGVGNKPADYTEQDVELVSYLSHVIWRIVEQKRANEQIRQLNARLEKMAMTDELTNLHNRRSFFLRGREEIKRAHRYETSLSLLMLDIDRFKKVNDTYGHEVGDLVLQVVAQTFKTKLREVDIVARLGGEEFGVLLPNTQPEEATVMAERLRAAIEALSFPDQGPDLRITFSGGISFCCQNTSNLDDLMRHADRGLYAAKDQGRNRVVHIEQGE